MKNSTKKKLNFKLFDDSGKKLKRIIKTAYIIEIIASIVLACAITYDNAIDIIEYVVIFIVSLAACLIVVTLLSLFTYGFAEIVDAAVTLQKPKSDTTQSDISDTHKYAPIVYKDNSPGNDFRERSYEDSPTSGNDYI